MTGVLGAKPYMQIGYKSRRRACGKRQLEYFHPDSQARTGDGIFCSIIYDHARLILLRPGHSGNRNQAVRSSRLNEQRRQQQ